MNLGFESSTSSSEAAHQSVMGDPGFVCQGGVHSCSCNPVCVCICLCVRSVLVSRDAHPYLPPHESRSFFYVCSLSLWPGQNQSMYSGHVVISMQTWDPGLSEPTVPPPPPRKACGNNILASAALPSRNHCP